MVGIYLLQIIHRIGYILMYTVYIKKMRSFLLKKRNRKLNERKNLLDLLYHSFVFVFGSAAAAIAVSISAFVTFNSLFRRRTLLQSEKLLIRHNMSVTSNNNDRIQFICSVVNEHTTPRILSTAQQMQIQDEEVQDEAQNKNKNCID